MCPLISQTGRGRRYLTANMREGPVPSTWAVTCSARFAAPDKAAEEPAFGPSFVFRAFAAAATTLTSADLLLAALGSLILPHKRW
jgi:hypothetical protein